jgi:hypothetical protein
LVSYFEVIIKLTSVEHEQIFERGKSKVSKKFGTLHEDELHNLYRSHSIFMIVKCNGQLTRIRRRLLLTEFWWLSLEKGHSECGEEDPMITLILILGRFTVNLGVGCTWFRILSKGKLKPWLC